MHSLIVGMTESGKTTLAKAVCRGYNDAGKITSVLDPLQDDGWKTDFQTQSPQKFLQQAKVTRSAYLFVDEGSVAIGRYNPAMEWLATQSRHFGHSSYFIVQGFTQLPPIVRGQCRKLFLFASALSVNRMAADEFNEPELLNAEKLGKGEFFEVVRFAQAETGGKKIPKFRKGRIDFAAGTIYYDNR